MAEKQTEENKNEEELSFYEKLTSTQKCAILMMLLGEDEASEILRNLGPKEVQQLGKEMYNVQGLDQDTVNKVLDEFLAIHPLKVINLLKFLIGWMLGQLQN